MKGIILKVRKEVWLALFTSVQLASKMAAATEPPRRHVYPDGTQRLLRER